jgi:hypothetical protein
MIAARLGGRYRDMAALGNQKPGQKIEPRIGRLAVIPSTLWQLGDGIGQEFFTFFMALGRLLAPYVFGVVAIAGSFIQACQLFRGGFGTLRCKLGFQFHRMVSDQVPTFVTTPVMAGSVILAGRTDPFKAVAGSPLVVLLVNVSALLSSLLPFGCSYRNFPGPCWALGAAGPWLVGSVTRRLPK